MLNVDDVKVIKSALDGTHRGAIITEKNGVKVERHQLGITAVSERGTVELRGLCAVADYNCPLLLVKYPGAST